MKYIIFEDIISGLIQPIIFGEHTTHSQIKIERAKPVSAGFVTLGQNGFEVHGKSESLKLSSKDGDLEILKLMFADAGTMYFTPVFINYLTDERPEINLT